ncbi:hypothetical protein [Nocardia nepalensis]|uniref:hypothetical protein n=1 Tax=Nocardia nepalensis TaxID=3375448 RepID=UPI003B6719FD
MAGGLGSLRAQLENLARVQVGPADWYQTVCDDIVGKVEFTQTWTHIDVRIQLVPDSGITPSVIGSLQSVWQTGIESTWNNPARLPGAAPQQWKCARTDEVPCRVSFRVHWVTTGTDLRVFVHNGPGRSSESSWYTTDPGSTAAHEFGHMLGLPDEYADPDGCPDRAPVGTGTVMDNTSNFVPQRLVQWVADTIGSNLQ